MAPPDINDIASDFRKRASGFGARRITLIVAGVLFFAFMMSSWFTVQPEETGVIQRFGAVNRTVGPGLHYKFPIGIESATMVPTARVLKEEFGFITTATPSGARSQYAEGKTKFQEVSLMLTGDLNVIDVQWIVQYRIEDPEQFLFQVRDPRQTIRDTAEAIMRQVVGNRLGSDVLTVGRVAVSTEVRDEMQRLLTEYKTGVRLVTVELQDVTPPDAVKPAFNEVNAARQDRERIINQAQERANREIPQARGEANRTISEAEGYAVERVNRAQGEATRFTTVLSDYRKAPEVTRQRLYLEAMSSILPGAKSLYVVDSEQKSLLPLLRLEGGQTPVPTNSAAASGAAAANEGTQ
jgi:membrane protease subunit HflK